MTIPGLQAVLADGYLVIRQDWYELALKALSGKHGCPFCGSKREPQIEKETQHFHARRGCLDCGEWWDLVGRK